MMDLHRIFVVISPLTNLSLLSNFPENEGSQYDAFVRLDGEAKINSQHDGL